MDRGAGSSGPPPSGLGYASAGGAGPAPGDGRAHRSVTGPHEGARLPRLVAIPSTDLLFVRFLEVVAGTLGSSSPRRLTLHLRALFPRLTIHRRDLAGEPAETWYVFRDGRLAPRLPDAWWEDPALATALIDESGSVHEANAAAGALFEVPDRDAVTVGSLAPVGAADDICRLLEIARSIPTVDTAIALRTRSGVVRHLAVHAAAAPGGTRVTLAPLASSGGEHQLAPICLPAWDDLFIERVERIAETLAGQDGEAAATRLETRIRERYPSALVRVASGVVGFGVDAIVLLVYRDGAQSPYADDRWWDRPEAARIVVADDRFVEANPAALRIYRASRAELVGARPPDFRAPEVEDDHVWLRDILVRTGQLHATSWLRRRDGTRSAIEVHSVLAPDGSIASALRELPPDR